MFQFNIDIAKNNSYPDLPPTLAASTATTFVTVSKFN